MRELKNEKIQSYFGGSKAQLIIINYRNRFQLVTGETFSGIRDFKALLLAEKDLFTKCLTEKILTYALGRELGFSDRPTVDAIKSATIAKGYGLRTLIHQVIGSKAFQQN